MVVVRARGDGKLRDPVDNTEGGQGRSRTIRDTRKQKDGVCKATYRIKTNFERENSSMESQTVTRITMANHRVNDHRSLEWRLEAWGR